MRIFGNALLIVAMTIFRFGLQGDVADAMLGKAVLELFGNLRPAAEVVDDHMGREGGLSSADGPHVDMMSSFYMLIGDKQLFDFL